MKDAICFMLLAEDALCFKLGAVAESDGRLFQLAMV